MSAATPSRRGIQPEADVDPFSSVSLPCGRTAQNRLIKVAMYEHLASMFGGPPNSYHLALYSQWARHGWGMIVTGNVQVSRSHLTLGRDIVLPETITKESIHPFMDLANSIHTASGKHTLAIMQLSHAGRQSPNLLGGRLPFTSPLAPSAIPVGASRKDQGFLSKIFHWFLFQTPREMSPSDIGEVVDAFAAGAMLAHESGFDGVQLHVAHGYLLAQFMSPKTNHRTDAYSCDDKNALRLLRRIVITIRSALPRDFVVGVKINAADYLRATIDRDGSLQEQNKKDGDETRALNHVREIASWGGVDFIEVSGGDYEDPDFMASVTADRSPGQAFFAQFSHQALKALESSLSTPGSPPPPLILLTGGLRTPFAVRSALSRRHANLLGFGRGAVLCPDLPEVLQRRIRVYEAARPETIPFAPEPRLDMGHSRFGRWPLNLMWAWLPKIKLVGAGVEMAWYVVRIRHLATTLVRPGGRGKDVRWEKGNQRAEAEQSGEMSAFEAVIKMWLWVGPRRDAMGRTRLMIYTFIGIGIMVCWLNMMTS